MNIKEIKRIAKKIAKGKLQEIKEVLMIADKTGWTVAHCLASNSGKIGWTTKDKEILILRNQRNWSVAHSLALHSNKTNWKTKIKIFL